jgi:hypothetical protein
MNNVVLYNSGVTTLSPVKYDKDTLYHTVSAFNNNGYVNKWTLTTWETSTSATPTVSRETPFYAYSNPTATFDSIPDPITTKSHEFTVAYTQSQSVPLKKWKMIWRNDSGDILEETDYSFRSSIINTFDGFVDGESYTVECIIENQYGVIISTGEQSFTVEYAAPTTNIVATATLLEESSAIQIDWSSPTQVIGYTSTTTPTFFNNFVYEDNTGLEIPPSAYIYWDVDIPRDFTCTFLIQFPSGFSGVFCQLDSRFEIGYDGTRFYYKIDSITEYFLPTSIEDRYFLIAIRPTDIYIREFLLEDNPFYEEWLTMMYLF